MHAYVIKNAGKIAGDVLISIYSKLDNWHAIKFGPSLCARIYVHFKWLIATIPRNYLPFRSISQTLNVTHVVTRKPILSTSCCFCYFVRLGGRGVGQRYQKFLSLRERRRV